MNSLRNRYSADMISMLTYIHKNKKYLPSVEAVVERYSR